VRQRLSHWPPSLIWQDLRHYILSATASLPLATLPNMADLRHYIFKYDNVSVADEQCEVDAYEDVLTVDVAVQLLRAPAGVELATVSAGIEPDGSRPTPRRLAILRLWFVPGWQPAHWIPTPDGSRPTVSRLRMAGAAAGRQFYLAVGLHKPHLPYQAAAEDFAKHPLDSINLPLHPEPPKNTPDVALQFTDGKAPGHTDPWHPITEQGQRTARRGYRAAITGMDRKLGSLLTELDSLGIAPTTAVVFHSDHGYHQVRRRRIPSDTPTTICCSAMIPTNHVLPGHDPNYVLLTDG
jgi:hypothetical protein